MKDSIFGVVILTFIFCDTCLCGQWDFYPSDEFNDDHLRPRWSVANATVHTETGKLVFKHTGSGEGSVFLRSAWSPGIMVPLIWPWAMETHMIFPCDSHLSETVLIGLYAGLTDGDGNKEDIIAGCRGVQVCYSLKNSEYTYLDRELISRARSGLFIRFEGIGDDEQRVRVGFKEHESDEWIWSQVRKVSRLMTHAEGLGLVVRELFTKETPNANSDETAAILDYIHFEGPGFEFGKKGNIEYIRDRPPKINIPRFKGEYYSVKVPDTLDIAERCALCLSAITEIADPEADYEPYCHVYFNPNGWQGPNGAYNPDMERTPPVFCHDYHGYNTGIGEGQTETIPLLQIASGSKQNYAIGLKMFDTMRRMIGDDGQTYAPLRGRPWALFLTWWLNNQQSGPWQETGQYQVGEPWRVRALSALASWYAAYPDPVLKNDIELMVDNLVLKNDVANTSIRGLVQAYRITGYQPALDLALSRLPAIEGMFKDDGSWSGHFHLHTQTLLSMLDLATVTKDHGLLEHVRRAYVFAKTKGWPIVGLFPEGTDSPPHPCETCEVAEMIQLAINLSQEGAGDYWDDVDRYSRNQFVEQQLIETDWIEKLCAQIPEYDTPTPGNYSGITNTIERQIGSFSSYGAMNEWSMFLPHSPGGAVGCCTGNGALGLYCIWNSLVTFCDKGLKVNLLLNRASKWADIFGYLPYEGRVEVHMKEDQRLWVRAPEWVQADEFEGRVNQHKAHLNWDGRYASPGKVKKGDIVTFTFPIGVRGVEVTVGEITYFLKIKGNTVVSVSPPGEVCPIYQRERYLDNSARIAEKKWFVSDRTIDW